MISVDLVGREESGAQMFQKGPSGPSTEAQSPALIAHLSRSWQRGRPISACVSPDADVSISSFLGRREEKKREEMLH